MACLGSLADMDGSLLQGALASALARLVSVTPPVPLSACSFEQSKLPQPPYSHWPSCSMTTGSLRSLALSARCSLWAALFSLRWSCEGAGCCWCWWPRCLV